MSCFNLLGETTEFYTDVIPFIQKNATMAHRLISCAFFIHKKQDLNYKPSPAFILLFPVSIHRYIRTKRPCIIVFSSIGR